MAAAAHYHHHPNPAPAAPAPRGGARPLVAASWPQATPAAPSWTCRYRSRGRGKPAGNQRPPTPVRCRWGPGAQSAWQRSPRLQRREHHGSRRTTAHRASCRSAVTTAHR